MEEFDFILIIIKKVMMITKTIRVTINKISITHRAPKRREATLICGSGIIITKNDTFVVVIIIISSSSIRSVLKKGPYRAPRHREATWICGSGIIITNIMLLLLLVLVLVLVLVFVLFLKKDRTGRQDVGRPHGFVEAATHALGKIIVIQILRFRGGCYARGC
ncbi:hypothetical protein T492DRAFT_27723 [Pavlovales sp. CCMP2436]|nr:hypothetical protein T492DRAFT_27723 [Pavlovales sp. CCMP2436]